ncbi:2-hydroxyacyl-CoA dehydratase family protein [Rhodococcus opacus]|uniref:2-hydroxyacyl-CoA dehydratase family protein n=1 Tax=Rhodococcus opacus TaxID=37919 RepID=A0ABT4NPA3_RHOOP|nr:2-hydroxyacyl-CoA dehydratase family protein [Rhodococcus opacus]MCZ4589205.1 2-hydroxyacyl-CoA dehydratase family protein [Rhodococcus opacus]MDV7089313.1 2-hydroxyacyl-CoA dehydratase family protein [Rhodococcus opacus]
MPETLTTALTKLGDISADPEAYVVHWKERTGGKVVGAFPMNFPAEIAHAAGALPVIIQENREPDSMGRNLLAEFYCGYTRNIADQAAKGRLDIYDGFFLADHCIQLLGATDVVRSECDDKPIHFGQFASSLGDAWTSEVVETKMRTFVDEMAAFTGAPITAQSLSSSIALFNDNRRLLRQIFAARTSGSAQFTSTQMQSLVKSAMVMDKAEHTALLRQIVDDLETVPRDDRIRLHLSGHFCHAPNPELLRALEECEALVVNDDLYHGARYISTDVPEDIDPVTGLVNWYLQRDVNIPCPTRVKHATDWEDTLIDSVQSSGAQAVIVLMAKFCEPHMLYYPQLRKRLTERNIPHLLIETEHDGVPVESIRTRVEALLERIRRTQLVTS